jgi:hypothetical protein
MLLGQIVLTVLILSVLYATRVSAATMALRFGARLAAEQGEQAIRPAGQAILWGGVGGGVDSICAGRARWDRSGSRRRAVRRDVDRADVF